jgi:predicted enzyme related to lactoylglutathione lyase
MMRTGIIANLFGWQLQDRPLPGWPHYAFLRHDSGIAGAVGTADATTAEVLVYVEVDDPQGVRRQGREARRPSSYR